MKVASAGNTQEYARILYEVTPCLGAISRLRLLPSEGIDDLVEDIARSTDSVRATYGRGRPILDWLFAITLKQLADAGRRYWGQTTHATNFSNYPVTFSPNAAKIGRESRGAPEVLRQAIDRLPQGQREANEVLKLREVSLKKVATASEASVGALEVSVHRVVGALRKALGRD